MEIYPILLKILVMGLNNTICIILYFSHFNLMWDFQKQMNCVQISLFKLVEGMQFRKHIFLQLYLLFMFLQSIVYIVILHNMTISSYHGINYTTVSSR
jgi:hypothetical protein